MFVSLLALGLVLAAAGLVTIGFGIPINAFSLGNTLIIAGTTAVVGGLILIGLAAAVRQLKRIAEALKAAPRPARATETVETGMVPPTARMAPVAVASPARPAMPPKPPEGGMPRPPEPRFMPEPRPAEPRAVPPQSNETPGPLDWLRPKSKVQSNSEPPVVEIPDEVPLSPRSTPRPMPSPLATMAESYEQKPWSPGRSDGAAVSKSAPASRSEHIARMSPAGEPSKDDEPRDAAPKESKSEKDTGLFDVAWPEVWSSRSGNEVPESKSEMRSRDDMEMRDESAADKRSEIPLGLHAERPVAILKSGVIDGMAYTLYADGSIEADLPQGTVKFASVDALRLHLEQHT